VLSGAFVADFLHSDNNDLNEVVETVTKDDRNGDKYLISIETFEIVGFKVSWIPVPSML
jgi:hypothetical protein